MSAEPKPSATVVVLRDAPALELLLLQRNRSGAPWVFPGGKVEEADRASADADVGQDVRRAAVRETREEAGLSLQPSELVPISRWITPELAPRRFDTWFFVGRLPAEAPVRVDGSEIIGHRWLAPRAALEAHHADEIRLAPPTFVTVSWLAAFSRAADAVEGLARHAILTFRPRICPLPDAACMLYPGDAGYEAGDPEREGARHRLWYLPAGWRYECDTRPGAS